MHKLHPIFLLLGIALALITLAGCVEDVSDARSTLTNDCSDCIDDTGGDTSGSGDGGDTTAFGDVSEFTATPGDGSITLSWSIPNDNDYAGLMIRKSTESFPSSIGTGSEVYNDSGLRFSDDGLDNGTTYYYTAFAHDGVPNYAGGVQSSAIPLITSPAGLTVAVVPAGNELV